MTTSQAAGAHEKKRRVESWLAQFLHRQLLIDRPGDRCTRLQLLHLGIRQRSCATWPISTAIDEEGVNEIGCEMLDAAQDDAAGLGGRQRYAIVVYREQRPDQVAESRVFLRQGGGGDLADEDTEVDSEGPTSLGLLAQLMRHNEANAKNMILSTQDVIQAQAKMITALSERNQRMEEQHLKGVVAYESLLSERHVRDLATKEHEMRARVFTQGMDKLSLLLPIVVNKLAGRRLMPEPTSVLNEMVGALFESITSAQYEKFGEILTPEQHAMVLNLRDARERQLDAVRAETDNKVAALGAYDGAGQRKVAPA